MAQQSPSDTAAAGRHRAIIGAWHAEGHVVVPGVLDRPTVARLVDHLDTLAPSPTGIAACSPELDPVAREVATDERLVALAALVLGAEPVAFGYSYLVKGPHTGLPVLWHQDGHPWREQLGVTEAVTVWVALDPSTVASGGLWVVPGSHRGPLHPLEPCDEPPNVFGWRSPPAAVDESAAVAVELHPGDAALHHPALLHRSGPNRTARRRAALALRYRSSTRAGNLGRPGDV